MRLCWVIGRLYGLRKRGRRSHTWRARSNVRRVLVIFFWIIRKSKYCFLEGIGSWGESERTIFWASCSWTRENAQKHRWWCWREDRWCTCTSPIPWTMFETDAILWPWDPEGMCSRSCSFQGYISMSVQKSHHVSRERIIHGSIRIPQKARISLPRCISTNYESLWGFSWHLLHRGYRSNSMRKTINYQIRYDSRNSKTVVCDSNTKHTFKKAWISSWVRFVILKMYFSKQYLWWNLRIWVLRSRLVYTLKKQWFYCFVFFWTGKKTRIVGNSKMDPSTLFLPWFPFPRLFIETKRPLGAMAH